MKAAESGMAEKEGEWHVGWECFLTQHAIIDAKSKDGGKILCLKFLFPHHHPQDVYDLVSSRNSNPKYIKHVTTRHLHPSAQQALCQHRRSPTIAIAAHATSPIFRERGWQRDGG